MPGDDLPALLFDDDGGLDKKHCSRLRTGRKNRKHRWRTGPGHGAVVQNMTKIDQRPPEIDAKEEAGHWEGDLVRHEALFYRAGVEDLRRCAVAAA